MRILYLMDQMHLHGGAEKILSQKINYLINHLCYEVYLITTEQNNKKVVYDLDSKLIWKDLKVNYIRELSYFHPKNLLKIIFHFWKLKSEIRRIQPDVIVSVSFSPEQYFLPFLHKEIPKIKEFHSSRFNYKPGSWIKKKLESSLEKYHVLVVLNETEKAYYKNTRIEIIPNFTDFKSIKKGDVVREKTILAAGRIAAVKQFDHLIQAWSTIATNFPDWQIKIFGDGDEALSAKLEQLIQELGVSNIYLMGATANLDQEMQKSSIYAMTSETECFPMVLLEAQAAGLAIVSYDCPNGPRNIINNKEDGFLVDNQNTAALAHKMRLLMEDETLRELFSKKARINSSKYTPDKVMDLWNDLFTELIAAK